MIRHAWKSLSLLIALIALLPLVACSGTTKTVTVTPSATSPASGVTTTATVTASATTSAAGSINTPTTQPNQAASKVTVTSSLSPSTYGQPVTFTATVSTASSSNNVPTGTVTFSENGTGIIGTESLDNNGRATLNISTLLGGDHSISATYAGDANFSGSSSSSIVQTVLPVDTTITVATEGSSPQYSDAAQNINLTATVTAAQSKVNQGKVTFMVKDSHGNTVGDTVWGTVTGGSASANYILPGGSSAGTYSIDADYSGGNNFKASSSNGMVSLTVNQAATTVVVSHANYQQSSSPQNITLTCTVTTADGSVVNQGTVTFSITGRNGVINAPVSGKVNGGVASVSYAIPGGFNGTYIWSITNTANYNIQAQYNGGDNFQASSGSTSVNP